MLLKNFLTSPEKEIKKISINFSGRSASHFFHQLLDGHPNIITFHEQYDIYVYTSLKKFFLKKLPLENLPDYLRKNLTYNFKLHQNIFNASLLKFDINIIYDQIEKIVKILIKKK